MLNYSGMRYFIRGACHRWRWGFNSSSSHDARARTHARFMFAGCTGKTRRGGDYQFVVCAVVLLASRIGPAFDFVGLYQGWITKCDSAYQSWIRFTELFLEPLLFVLKIRESFRTVKIGDVRRVQIDFIRSGSDFDRNYLKSDMGATRCKSWRGCVGDLC